MNVLEHDFIKVNMNGQSLYGGNQNLLSKKRFRGYACGLIAIANILSYNALSNEKKRDVSEEDYVSLVKKLSHFIPVIPHFGINGIEMAIGLNIYFLSHKIKRVAIWNVIPFNIFCLIRQALDKDEPIVLAIGPNFPNLLGNHRLNLYKKEGDSYVVCYTSKAHYVTVTAMDSKWMKISTWGEECYINREEYKKYIKKYSSSLFSNVLIIL